MSIYPPRIGPDFRVPSKFLEEPLEAAVLCVGVEEEIRKGRITGIPVGGWCCCQPSSFQCERQWPCVSARPRHRGMSQKSRSICTKKNGKMYKYNNEMNVIGWGLTLIINSWWGDTAVASEVVPTGTGVTYSSSNLLEKRFIDTPSTISMDRLCARS